MAVVGLLTLSKTERMREAAEGARVKEKKMKGDYEIKTIY